MNISKYFLLAIITFSANNSTCMYFFTREQIAAAEHKPAPLSPRKKTPSAPITYITVKPEDRVQHAPLAALFNPVPDHVQEAYANWGLDNAEQCTKEPKGKDNLLSSQESTMN